jgi:GNAT superfamily N-acetyltransferase
MERRTKLNAAGNSTTDEGWSAEASAPCRRFELVEADSPLRLDEIRRLFLEYATELGGHICFADLREKELPNLPGAYARPSGRLLLALVNGAGAGCAALRAHSPSVGELKRLYLRPEFRRLGLGRRLAERLIAEARALQLGRLILDTLPSMKAAHSLYETLGFRVIGQSEPDRPIEMELRLG